MPEEAMLQTLDTVDFCPTTGIEQPENQSQGNTVKIFPNPLSDFATLEFENPNNTAHTLLIFSATGQMINKISSISTSQVRIDKKNLKGGLYIFLLQSNSEIVGRGKFVIN